MRVKITMHLQLDDDEVDETHPTGMTSEAYDELTERLLGFDDIDAVKA